jgi:hypothetical protein
MEEFSVEWDRACLYGGIGGEERRRFKNQKICSNNRDHLKKR